MNEPPDWFGELDQEMSNIAEEMNIIGHNFKQFSLRIDRAMHKAARARDREIIEREDNARRLRQSAHGGSAAEDQSEVTGDPSAEVGGQRDVLGRADQ